MSKTVGTAVALLAAIIAVVIVVAGGPVVAAVAVAAVGGVLGSFAARTGHKSESVGIR